jgi:hypothetical protein
MTVFSSCKSIRDHIHLFFLCGVPQQAGRGPLFPYRNDPKSARRPLRRPQMPRIPTASPGPGPDCDRDKDTHNLVKAFSTLSSLAALTDSDSEKKTRLAGDVDDDRPAPTTLPAHVAANVLEMPGTPKTPLMTKPKPKSTPAKTPRTSKKALALAEQEERAAYAESLFGELNRSVFAGGLPVETTLTWSNRLLTTAGRARWHR